MLARKGLCLSQEEIEIIRQLFDLCDSDCSGKVNPKEIVDQMRKFDLHNQDPTIFELFLDIAEDGRTVTFETFMESINNKVYKSPSHDDIRKMFNLYAHPTKGTISMNSFDVICKSLGEKISSVDLKAILEGNRISYEITFDEYLQLIQR